MDHMNPSTYKKFVLYKLDTLRDQLHRAVKPTHRIEDIMFEAGQQHALDLLKEELNK